MDFNGQQILRNCEVILREEFPDAPVLYDPATDDAFSLNSTGLLVWKHLDECPTLPAMIKLIDAHHDDVAPDVALDVDGFVRQLVARGLAGRR